MLKEALIKITHGSRIHRLFTPWYGGHTSILLLHRVTPGPKLGMPTDGLEVTPEFLDTFIQAKKRDGWRFVSMDYLVEHFDECLARKNNMVVTLDDGYRDNYSHAWPLFKAHGIQFTVYVTDSFPNGTADLWWYTFVDILGKYRWIEIEHRNVRLALDGNSPKVAFEKFKGFYTVLGRGEQQEVMTKLLARYPLESREERLWMSWEEIREMAGDGLCTIGCHTLNHPNLRQLSNEDAYREMSLAKVKMEERIGKPVHHFAYPYGTKAEASVREEKMAREAGFRTAVTTRIGNIFEEHLAHLHMLPRIPLYEGGTNGRLSEICLSGMYSALTNGFRKVVTD